MASVGEMQEISITPKIHKLQQTAAIYKLKTILNTDLCPFLSFFSGKRLRTLARRRRSERICTNCVRRDWEIFTLAKWIRRITWMSRVVRLTGSRWLIIASRATKTRRLEVQRVPQGEKNLFTIDIFKLIKYF